MSDLPDCDRHYCKEKSSASNSLQDSFKSCSCKTTNDVVSLRERKAKFTIYNADRKEITVCCIDPCIKMLQNDLRCDYIAQYEIDDKKYVVYIELKGSDAAHGCDQLLSTVDIFKEIHTAHKRYCRLAVHRPPSTSYLQKRIQKFSKKHIDFSIEDSMLIP